MEKLKALSSRHEIRLDFILKLRQLEGFNIVLLLDDSGSMNSPCAPGGGHTVNPFQSKLPTRWDELKQTCTVLIDLATALDPVGPDVFFLNRPPVFCVNDVSQLNVPFSAPPAGFTPISKAFKYILEAKKEIMAEKKLLSACAALLSIQPIPFPRARTTLTHPPPTPSYPLSYLTHTRQS